jgi:hypothetical protein
MLLFLSISATQYLHSEDHRQPKRKLQDIPAGGRREKLRKRWLDDMEDDLRKIGVKRRIKATDRTEWRKI